VKHGASDGSWIVSRRAFLLAALATSTDVQADRMKHVALLGDSVFDNGAYVSGGPDVGVQLRTVLRDYNVTMLARDGAVMADLADQIRRLPSGVSHLVVSIGGNDALGYSGILQERATSVGDALEKVRQVGDRFSRSYSEVLALLSLQPVPVAVCTIYEPRYPIPQQRRTASTALAILNDVITRLAFVAGHGLIDLRSICDDDEDFANPIEPSVRGGGKIADAIARFALGQPSASVVAKI
jgi:hypothetical protein